MTHSQDSYFSRWTLATGAGFAMVAVMTGAFAAHGLKNVLDPYSLGIFETAARYQMYHAIALLIVSLVSGRPDLSRRWLKLSAFSFGVGIILFSGSLYLLALTGNKFLGAITPLGGIAFIFGWLALVIASVRASERNP